MRADPRFLGERKSFWANVRTISEACGYTVRGKKTVKEHRVADMAKAMRKVGLESTHLRNEQGPTELGRKLEEYFTYRATILNEYVEPRLMDAETARALFNELFKRRQPRCPIPKNKQKGDKAGPAYLTGIVNMLVEEAVGELPVNYDPKNLTTFTQGGSPLRTLSRRVDGAFPR